MGALSSPLVLHHPGVLGARTLPASWLQTAVAGSGWVLVGSPLAPPPPPGPGPPGGALSTEQKSVFGRSIQQCAATCRRPRPACAVAAGAGLMKSWHSVGEGSRLWLPTHPWRPHILSPRPSLPTMLVILA